LGNTECTNAVRTFIGVLGWEWPEWELSFYPEDMPPEWRLTYYNTQFNCVFVPFLLWSAQSEAVWAQWAEDTHDQFLFLLEAGANEPVPAPLRAKAQLISRDDPEVYWFDQSTDIKRLAEGLKTRVGTTVYVLSQDGDMGQIERVRTLMGLLGLLA